VPQDPPVVQLSPRPRFHGVLPDGVLSPRLINFLVNLGQLVVRVRYEKPRSKEQRGLWSRWVLGE
jgi:hypothetical protein